MRARAQLLEAAANFVGSQSDVTSQFRAAVASNMSVVRMFGHGVATGFHLQDPAAPGTYSERAFQAFDYVLDQAARFKLKLVISLANNWDTDSNSDNKCAALRRFNIGDSLQRPPGVLFNPHPLVPRAPGAPRAGFAGREQGCARGRRGARRQVCVHGRRGEPGRVLHLGVRAQGVHGARAHRAGAREHHQQQGAPPVLRAACFRRAAPGEPVLQARPAHVRGARAARVRSGARPPAPPTRCPARKCAVMLAWQTRAAPGRRRRTAMTTRSCPGT